MLCYSLPDPNDDEMWMEGRLFTTKPTEPVIATIIPGYEHAELMPYFDNPQLVSNAFHEALVEAGVDNIEVFDAIIRSEDGSIEHRGYKAMNIVGLVRAADLSETVFSPDNPSRLLDASIEKLVIDENATMGFLMFRLAESVDIVLVHETVKNVIEEKGFPHVVFYEPGDIVTL
jgi:hypothetical protein